MSTEFERITLSGNDTEFTNIKDFVNKVLYINDNISREEIGKTSYVNETIGRVFIFYSWINLFKEDPTTKQQAIDEVWLEDTIAINHYRTKEEWAEFINSVKVFYDNAELV